MDVEVAGLGGALKEEAERGDALEADLRKFAGRLSQETGVLDSFNPARESLSTRNAALLDRLTMLHRTRATILETLHSRNAGSLDEAERILGMTGLNRHSPDGHCQRNVGVPTNLDRLWFQAAI